LIKNVNAEEISEMEQSLISEGFPPEQIQKLCDMHVAVFESSLKKAGKPAKLPGHPIHTYMLENKEAKKIIRELNIILKKAVKLNFNEEILKKLVTGFNEIKKFNIHFQRKENQLFPYLEKKGFTGPSKVMWGKHDEIRSKIKEIENGIKMNDYNELLKNMKMLFAMINNMIFMEERILFPASLKKISQIEWSQIKNEEIEIGYAWVKSGNIWDANMVKGIENKKGVIMDKEKIDDNLLHLDEGNLSIEQVNLMLKNLPVDVSYVDENDIVKYYSANKERIFPRSPGVIGRSVQNCHPQKSVHIVNKILEAFKKKEKDVAEFWITLNDKFLHIRYFSLYDKNGNYKGVIEVTQDITEIRKLERQKRLLDWK
jgi:DUF438 domain-containing protein